MFGREVVGKFPPSEWSLAMHGHLIDLFIAHLLGMAARYAAPFYSVFKTPCLAVKVMSRQAHVPFNIFHFSIILGQYSSVTKGHVNTV